MGRKEFLEMSWFFLSWGLKRLSGILLWCSIVKCTLPLKIFKIFVANTGIGHFVRF
jgi:hypothetical protein